ncbi:filamentous hemagglutinin family outer membrane protein [Gloeomargarita lithophora Alchichica-D10]|uniref:Filamentous hemagglutinin family outer membrane protein n=1 Tax=Gloeomargarita lithophora Alchichica-D10 TaxID=1188229 RepID=A0A1J0AH84_9CYAN|nr:CHAT domain-containing protein [Gloeomargarita lithophora]APB35306.1 filamentous hemagglutinin family outer membrane protein [Gloeomargarita lithophora Alchichica-D10]
MSVRAQITPNGLGTQVNQNGNTFNIQGGTQSGRNLFHSFHQFGLNQGQVANFFSNPNIANILARVNGGSASYINGLIQVLGGNSNLFLMNPAGIIFGPNASLNVPAAFTATTADRILFPGGSFNAYGNNDYAQLVGEPIGFAFDRKDPAAIVNEGKLTVNPGQSVSLIAGQVINTGTIQAPNGNITITAVPGENLVRLSQTGQLLSLEFNPQQAAQYADNAGNIPITRLPELLTGGGVTTVTQNSNGTVSVAGSNLQIPTATGTTIISGKLDVSSGNQTGGKVGVFGTNIALVNSEISASGFTGGGEILIGGEFQGKGTQPNAQYTFVNNTSKLSADAISTGDGGRVIVWADKNTQFSGTIAAKGGELSGNGGFVEVSGKENLGFQGKVDTSAPQGKAGTLLLDPNNITIDLIGLNDLEILDGEILFGDGGTGDFTISTLALVLALVNGDVILQATNNITLQTTINYNGIGANRNLTFEANNNIFINAGIFDSAPGGESLNVNFQANFDGIGGGNVVLNDPLIKTEGANFTASGVDINVKAGSVIETISPTGNSGNITLNGTGQVAIFGGATVTTSTNANNNAGNIIINAVSNITIDDFLSTGVVGLGTGNAGSISIASTNGNITTTSLNAQTQGTGTAGDITLSALGITTTGGTITNSSTGGGTPGNISLTATDSGINIVNTQILSGGGMITIDGTSTSGSGVIIQNNSIINSGTGGINITGFTNANVDDTDGILISSGSEITSLDSFIEIFGTNEASGGDDQSGVRFNTGGKIIGLGTTDIQIDGLSSLSPVNTSGVRLETAGTVISADQGNINIRGGGRNTDPSTRSVFIDATSDIISNKNVFVDGNGVVPNGGNINLLGNINGSEVGVSGVGITQVNNISASGGDIFVGGELGATILAGGIVSTSAVGFDSGNITLESSAGAVNILGTITTEALGNDNAGNITINAAGNFSADTLISSSVTGVGTGNAGDISITSGASLLLNSNLFTTTDGTGKGGNITLNSTGIIDTNAGLVSSASTGGGDGGNITFNAGGNILVNNIFNTGEAGGNVSLTSTTGDIDLSAASFGISTAGPSLGSGDITLTANNGSIINAANLFSSSLDSQSGSINITAGSDVNVGTFNSASDNGIGGNITVNAGGDIFVGNTLANVTVLGSGTGGDISFTSSNGLIQIIGNTDTSTLGTGVAGSVNLTAKNSINVSTPIFTVANGAAASGDITITSINSTITTDQLNSSSFTSGDGGKVTLGAFGDITVNEEIFTTANGLDHGGAIEITSTNGKVDIIGQVNSLSTFASAGDVTITAKNSVNLAGGLLAPGANGGGDVSVVSNTDSITIGNLSLNTIGGNGTGGTVNLQAATTIDVPFGIETTSNLQGGDIKLIAGGDITVGNGTFLGLRSFGTASGNAGTIQITSTGGSLNVNSNPFEGIIASATSGTAGSININVANDVNVTGQITSGSTNSISKSTTITAGGDVNVLGKVQASSNVAGGAGLITIDGADITLTDGWGTGNGGGVKITADTLTTGASNSGSSAVNLTVGDVNFLGTIEGFGFLGAGTITITAPTGGVFVNDTGLGLNLTPGDLAQLSGFSTVTLGSSTIPLTVGIGGITFTSSAVLVGNTVNVQGNVTSPGTLTLAAANNLNVIGDLDATAINLNSGGGSNFSGNLTSAGGAISFNIASVINLTQNLNLNDPTTIQAGSINANGFNIFNTNFDTNILAPGAINLNDIITSGGAVTINSGSSVAINKIQTFSPMGSGAITISASGDIKTGNLQTEIISFAVDGAPISLTSGGTVTTGDILTFSQGGGNGGAVNIIASTAVTTQAIDTSSTTGIGGKVFIDPIGDVQVKYINTQGGTQGGDVDITAGRYFRAIGAFTDNGGVTASISTRGGSGGAITIKHGGNGIVPFIVGDASVNGTLGAITTGGFTILPFEEFLNSTILGNIRILTLGAGSNSIVNNILFSVELGDSPLEIELDEGETTLDTDAIDTAEIADRLAAGDIEAVATLDQLFADQFADFYGAEPLNNFRTVAEVQNALADMAAQTGTRPALLYILADERQLNLVLIPPGRGQGVADIPILEVVLNNLESEVQLLTQKPGAPATYRAVPEAKGEVLAKTISQFLNGIKDPRQRNSENYKKPAQQLYQWLIAPIEAALEANKIDTIMLVPDVGLRTLPYGALFDGQQFLIEKYSIGQIPSINLVDMNYRKLQGSTVLAMGASEFKQQQPLPAVPIELQTIAQEWGGKVFMNQEFTIDNLVKERQRTQFQMLHLATHGEFRPSRLTDSYIEFWNDRLLLNQLRELPLRQPPVELMVLSACRTAVGDKNTELGFAGLAVGAGVKSVVASSWYVSDEGTLGLMSEFYQQLQNAPTKALALRQVQIGMIRGDVRLQNNQIVRPNRPAIKIDANIGNRQLSHPYYWAAFTMIGSPW